MNNIIANIMKIYLQENEYTEVMEHVEVVVHYAELALDRFEKEAEKCKFTKESNSSILT